MSWVLTYTGKEFDLRRPKSADVCIEDIAHSLSCQARFNGHTKYFYSVAQHSYACSLIVPPQYQLAALLHDAAEAYTGDIVQPLKETLGLDLRTIEIMAEQAVANHFGEFSFRHACVKHADLVMLATERRDLMRNVGPEWLCLAGIEPLPEPIEDCWLPSTAKANFLTRFHELWAIRECHG